MTGDERRLVQRGSAGEMDAAAELYDRYAAQVYALARRIVRNDGDAQDVVQEVFSQAWRTAERYESSRGSVIGWLLMITRTRAIDKIRARQARPDLDPAELPDALPAGGALPPDLLVAAEQAGRVRQALLALPETQRTALELAYYEGLTQSEIAARLSEPLGTIKTRIRTALSTLRARLRT
jgi:RNA polymerase sigma-70 factor (ECF subfamily)